MKKWLSWLFALVLCISCFPVGVASAALDNTHVNTGDMAADIVAVAETQIGYYEGSLSGEMVNAESNNYQKYGVWYDNNVDNIGGSYAAWCATFVSWCANQAGIPSDIVYYHAYCPYGVSWFKQQGLFEDAVSRGGTYVPKAGDLIYFAPAGSITASQIGIVRFVKDDCVYTIEGNTYAQTGEQNSDGVFAKKYSLAYSRILGYATPQYASASFPENTLTSDVLSIDVGVVSGVPCGTIGQLTENLSSAFTLTVKENGVALADDDIVKTGQCVEITDGETVIASFAVAVNDDFNGDGVGNTTDVRDILRNISLGKMPSRAQRLALGKDIDGNISTADARQLLCSLIAT